VQLGVPSLESSERVRDLTPIGPRLARPRVLLDDGDEVEKPAVLHEVVHEMSTWTHPHLRGDLEVEVLQAIRRHQTAIGDTSRESGLLGA
jgi:hypothetical protein